jgi:hypothetical protein
MYDEEAFEVDFLLDAAYEAEQDMLHAKATVVVDEAARAHGLSLTEGEREERVEELLDGAEIEWDCGDEREDLESLRPILRFQKSAMLVVAKALPAPMRRSVCRPRPHARQRRTRRVCSRNAVSSRGEPSRPPRLSKSEPPRLAGVAIGGAS